MDPISLSLYLLYFWGCSVYAVLAPFYPQYAYDKGLNEKEVGYIFSLYAMIAFCLSPVNGKIMNLIGRKNVLLFGGITESIGMLLFTWVVTLDGNAFLTFSIIARILMGVGGSALLVTCFAVISNLYPDEMEEKIGIMETLGGVGLMAGPFIGGLLFAIGGYNFVMITYTVLFLVLTGYTYKVLPVDNPEQPKQDEKVSYKDVLTIPKVILALIVVVFGMAGPSFLEPVLSKFLSNELNLGSTAIGFVFALPTLGYTIAMKLLTKIPKEFDRRHVFLGGLLLEGLSFVFVGPWTVISDPNLITASFGLFLLGFGSAWAYIPSLPYLTDISIEKWPRTNKEHLGNTLSTIMGTTHYFGESVGPIFGGLSCYAFGTANGFAFFGGLILIYFVVFGLVSGQFSSIVNQGLYARQEDSSVTPVEKDDYDKIELGKA
jgi:MFS family permease